MTLPAADRLAAAPFRVERRSGPPASLVVSPGSPDGRTALLVRPDRRALVLGSAQPDGDADRAACAVAGVEVVRRRSGGGAVLVGPADQVWLDVFVPFDDPLYEPDVSRASWWLGELWVEALAAAGMAGCAVHRGPLVTGPHGRTACFAGLGPGEVTAEGRKLVGISQRRDRRGAWLFSMALCPEPPGRPPLEGLLRLGPAERSALASELDRSTTVLAVPPGELEAALVARLT